MDKESILINLSVQITFLNKANELWDSQVIYESIFNDSLYKASLIEP